MMLGIDRLDYTKGIPGRLQAFAEALTSFPDILKRITFVQIIIPSRTDVPRYQKLKEEIERLVGQINGQFTQPGWTPVQYMYRSLKKDELLSYYRCADIGLVTPLKDGMNLVAKEYCACNVDKRGAIILSEFAGAAAELFQHAVLVTPFDIKGVAAPINSAFTMSKEERSQRMSALRQIVRRNNVFHWVESFLLAAAAESLRDLGKMVRKPVPTHPVFTP
jgi:trehalose 6-phosphate synthase